jgi:excisionase family DNA binding protein
LAWIADVPGRLLTTREVADRLALSPATVLRRWRAGELPGFRLASNVLRFDADELDAWLSDRRGGAYPRVPKRHRGGAQDEAGQPCQLSNAGRRTVRETVGVSAGS